MNFYESPVFIDVLLGCIYVLLIATLGLTVWSMVRSLTMRERPSKVQGIPARRIAWGVFALLVATLALTCLLADTTPMTINGHAFTDTFWLRVSDMLINSSLILMIVAIVCTILGMWGVGRMRNK